MVFKVPFTTGAGLHACDGQPEDSETFLRQLSRRAGLKDPLDFHNLKVTLILNKFLLVGYIQRTENIVLLVEPFFLCRTAPDAETSSEYVLQA